MTLEQELAVSVATAIKAATLPIAGEIAELRAKQAALVAQDTTADVRVLHETVTDLRARLVRVEDRAAVPGPPGEPGLNGKDVDPVMLERVVVEHVTKALAALPPPSPGKDADMAAIYEAIESKVTKAVASLPPPLPGKDADMAAIQMSIELGITKAVAALPPAPAGKDVDMDVVQRSIDTGIAKAVALLPPPRPGKDADMQAIQQAIELGITKAVAALPPPLPGKDADMDVVQAYIAKAVAAFPRPKDGEKGEPGRDGRDGLAAVLPAVSTVMREYVAAVSQPIMVRLDALEHARGIAPDANVPTSDEFSHESDDELVKAAVLMMRDELALSQTSVSRVQTKTKRVVRDTQGRIENIIEESVA